MRSSYVKKLNLVVQSEVFELSMHTLLLILTQWHTEPTQQHEREEHLR